MLPDYMIHEIVRQLSDADAAKLAHKVGLDVAQPLPELPDELLVELPYSGVAEFTVSISAFGLCHSVPCRVRWTAELMDNNHAGPGEALRVPRMVHYATYALVRSLENPPFKWTALDENLLPWDALRQLEDVIDEQARQQELSRNRTQD